MRSVRGRWLWWLALWSGCAGSPRREGAATGGASTSAGEGGRLTAESAAAPGARAPAPAPTATRLGAAGAEPELTRATPLPNTHGARTASPPPSRELSLGPITVVHETPKRRQFSVDGYFMRELEFGLGTTSEGARHRLLVQWPAGARNGDGARCAVASLIEESWYRALVNTLRRVPVEHARLLRRVVIDNRPREHGIAPHDRTDPEDGRDGHTIWLHEDVFRAPNHWARGNYGQYWSYHLDEDGRTLVGVAADHEWFSPVLIHELGHLVMYRVVNAAHHGPAATSAPACAEACGGAPSCRPPSAAAIEQGCATPYCHPFRFETRTENWAEQYRLFYQSSASRAALLESGATCLELLEQLDEPARTAAWERGLPDRTSFVKSRWASCGERPCKAW